MPRLFLTMADGSEKQYDATEYAIFDGATLRFSAAQGVFIFPLWALLTVRVLEIDAAVAETGLAMTVHTGHGTD